VLQAVQQLAAVAIVNAREQAAGADLLALAELTGQDGLLFQQGKPGLFPAGALFAVRRADIEGFARDLEARGRARATVTRRLSTIAGFYKYAVEEELLDHSPAAHVRRPRQVVTIPLAPRTARAIDLATGERCDGPVFLAAGGRRLDRHGAGRIVRRVARRAGISKNVGPHTLRHAFITAALDAGVPLRDVQEAASPR
jgi:site-specific recombinase XerD